jgi:NitT/TauT family transport system permease protein
MSAQMTVQDSIIRPSDVRSDDVLVPAEAVIESQGKTGKDIAALLSLFFMIVTYHILHPTMLFRVQFGETFRDRQEEGFQQALALGLLISGVLLMGSLRRTWDERHQVSGRLRLAFVAGLGIYIAHVIAVIHSNYNVFLKIFDIEPEVFLDSLEMRASLATVLAPPITALNSLALLGGVGLASIIFLWSPWEYCRVSKDHQRAVFWVKSGTAMCAIALWYMTYHALHPIWQQSNGSTFRDIILFPTLGLLIAVVLLIAVTIPSWRVYRDRVGRLQIAMIIGAGLFIAYALAISIADYDILAVHHELSASAMDELLLHTELTRFLQVTDRGALLAGIGIASIIYLWSPWESLNLYRKLVINNLPAIAVAILFVFAWEKLIDVFDIKQFLLPKPTVIWDVFREEYPSHIAGAWFTVQNAIKGFLFGCGAGILTGIVSARFIRFSRAIVPLAVAANAVPIIAFAPISNRWFGFTSPNSNIAIVAVLCYFPAMISTVQGLTSADARQVELLQSYAASDLQIFRYVRIPSALPFIFSALKLATTLAMIGSIVAEYFGGSPHTALGFAIKNDAALLNMTESWSRIIIASGVGIGFYMLVTVLEFNSMPWYGSFRSESH